MATKAKENNDARDWLVFPPMYTVAGRQTILDELVRDGRAEWEDAGVKKRCTIFWKSLEDWASLIYAWAKEEGKIGDIFTLYEIRCSDEQEDTPFYNMHEGTFRSALKVLAEDGRAILFEQEGEEGIKFFDLA
eukprot:g450.t1